MGYVLTKDSKVSCDHPATGGGAAVLATVVSVLKIDGSDVLSDTLAGTALAAGCNQVNAANGESPCVSIAEMLPGGVSQVLNVEGKPVILESVKGKTGGGMPDQSWSAKDAAQTLLKAD